MTIGWSAKRCFALEFLLTSLLLLGAASAFGQSQNLAPGFEAIPRNARIVVMPVDIELFSVSAGGILEPRADWTDAAARNLRAALLAKQAALAAAAVELTPQDADDFSEINTLHAAIARAISMHHFGDRWFSLPTKDGKLDWSMGESVAPIKAKTGADYALFTWLRDSYASGQRIATIIIMALLGVGMPGGMQVGYASLVDLNTGRVLWFNQLLRASGDLREPDKAAETLEALLSNFPPAQ